MQRIVPFVDHEIGNRLLKKLLAQSDSGRFEIPAVVTTQENHKAWWPGVHEICSNAKIPLFVYEPPFAAPELLESADWFLLLSWKHIIPPDLIELPSQAVINLHYSLLPSFRGVYPVNWAIINGEKKTGFTFHFVNEKIDDGEAFMKVEVPVRLSDTAKTLHARMDDTVVQRFDEFLDLLLKFDIRSRPRSKGGLKKAEIEYYSRERFERACFIDLKKSYLGSEILNLLRGLTFFEGSRIAYIIDEKTNKKVYVTIALREDQ